MKSFKITKANMYSIIETINSGVFFSQRTIGEKNNMSNSLVGELIRKINNNEKYFNKDNIDIITKDKEKGYICKYKNPKEIKWIQKMEECIDKTLNHLSILCWTINNISLLFEINDTDVQRLCTYVREIAREDIEKHKNFPFMIDELKYWQKKHIDDLHKYMINDKTLDLSDIINND